MRNRMETLVEAHAARRVRVEPLMGTVFSIDLRDLDVPQAAIADAFSLLKEVDRRFSPFLADSEITRLGEGRLTLDECHPDVGDVLSLCEKLRRLSGGAFNAWRFRRDGRLDPSGVVKGWAVDQAGRLPEQAGARNFCINAGGDVLARGQPSPQTGWRIGIRNPEDAKTLAAVIEVADLAVATSGSYERGAHIIDARTGAPAPGLSSLTVVGPTMTWADAYATIGFAMGPAGVKWASSQTGHAAYGVGSDGRVLYDAAFARLLV